MTPKQFSEALRQVASKIDNSENPSKTLVISDLQKIFASLDSGKPESGIDERRQKELERRKQKESEETLKKTQEEMGKQVEKLVEDGFKNLERQIR